jgi:Rnl2 family RNA ligase
MFRKFPEIENHYRTKEVQYVLDKFPHMENETYILQEKLDGACVSFVFEADGSFRLAKRSGLIEVDENFYGIQRTVLEKYMDVVAVLQSFAKKNKCSLNVFGELFGNGIQRRINYGSEKYILFFDMMVDGKMMSPVETEDIFSSLNIEDMLVPNFGTVKGFNKALEFDVESRTTLVNPDGNDLIEGVVIKPYYGIFQVDDVGTFYLKKKAEKFAERSKPKRERPPVDSNLQFLQDTFRDYINENRVLSVFSKHGEIERFEDIGIYIKAVIEDAKKDFEKDYFSEVEKLEKKDVRYVYNVSKSVVELLKKYL